MSDAAVQEQLRKQGWAAPGGIHDVIVRFLKVALPASIGVLLAYLALAPLQKGQEISFILDKSKVDVAKERMRAQAARYRGLDNKGRLFTLDAASAVQASSSDPIVDITGMAARIGLEGGAATIRADKGRYNMEAQRVDVIGPILLQRPDGYELQTRDVAVDLNTRRLQSRGRVQGRMPLGSFTADTMVAELPEKEVVLAGNVRLHIRQGAIR